MDKPTQDLSAPLTVNGVPMYPRREWQGLTDEEIDDMMPYAHNEFDILENHAFARAIEQALKEKNNG